MAFSPDGTRRLSAASMTINTVKVWDASSGRDDLLTLKGPHRAGSTAKWHSPPTAGGLPAASGDGTVKVWDASSGQVDSHSQRPRLRGPQRGVQPRRPADCQRKAGTRPIKVWDASSGQDDSHPQRAHGPGPRAWHSAPTARQDCLSGSCGSRPMQSLGRCPAARRSLTLKGHTGWGHSVAFSPDGTRLASGVSPAPGEVP